MPDRRSVRGFAPDAGLYIFERRGTMSVPVDVDVTALAGVVTGRSGRRWRLRERPSSVLVPVSSCFSGFVSISIYP